MTACSVCVIKQSKELIWEIREKTAEGERKGCAALSVVLSVSHQLHNLRQTDTVPALLRSAAVAASALLGTAASAALSRAAGLSARSASAS